MGRLFQVVTLSAAAVIAVACTQAGNNGPGGLPAVGNYSTPQAGTADCAGAANCATLPSGDQAQKPAELATSFPDFPGKTEFQAVPGSAFTLLVVTSAADSASMSCTPANSASLTSSGPSDHYLFYLDDMPNQDVPCTITATGPKGEVKTSIVVHPAQPNTVVLLEVRNLPALFAIGAGISGTIHNFYIQGFDASTDVTAACGMDKTPTLIKNPTFVSWYSLKVTAAPSPVETDTCTVTANRKSDNQTASGIVKMLYTGPIIRPINFIGTSKLVFLPFVGGTPYVAVVDPGPGVPPLPMLLIPDASEALLSLSCTDDHGAKLMTHEIQNTVGNTYTLIIQYTKTGDEGSTDTCTVMTKDPVGKVLSAFPITMIHTQNPLLQTITGVPANITITGKPVTIQPITVKPMDADTQLAIQCSNDKTAYTKPESAGFIAVVAQTADAYETTDNCTIIATHNGIQTAAVPLVATIEHATFKPANFTEDFKVYMGQDKTHPYYTAYNVVASDPNAISPTLAIDDPDGIKTVTITCKGPTQDYFNANDSDVFKSGDLYSLDIRYTQPQAKNPIGVDNCIIKVVDSTGQISYKTVTLNW